MRSLILMASLASVALASMCTISIDGGDDLGGGGQPEADPPIPGAPEEGEQQNDTDSTQAEDDAADAAEQSDDSENETLSDDDGA